jgi:hypothetical protein
MPRSGRHDVTPREQEVLEHLPNIKGKLRGGSPIEIVRIALRDGLVETAS